MSLSREMKIVIIIIVGIVVLFWGVIMILSRMLLGPRPPRPEITRGEFDFRLEYEVNGERIVIEDTIIVQFDGFSADSGSMAWFPTWRLHLASNRRARHLLLLELEDGRRIYYHLVSPGHYYMGDVSGNRRPRKDSFNSVFYVERRRDTSIGNRRNLTNEELLSKFGIRLISWEWEHDPPIENNFE